MAVYKAENVVGGSTTVTVNASSSVTMQIAVEAYKNVPTSGVVDAASSCQTNTSNTSMSSPSITTTLGDELVVGFIQCQNCTSIAPGGTETERQERTGFGQIEDLGASSTGSYTMTWTLGASKSAITAAISLKAIPPSYTAGPAASSTTATTITDSLTPSVAATEYGVAYRDTLSAPTCTQIKAGQDSSGSTAAGSNSKSVSGADTLVITPSGTVLPRYNTSHCLSNTAGDSAVSTITGRTMAAPTGFQFVTITSVDAGTPCASFNAATNPDIANGDILKAPTTMSPGASCALTITAACQFSYGNPCGSERESALNIAVYDASAGAYHTDDIDFWSNNQSPNCPPPNSLVLFLPSGTITPIDTSVYSSDAEGDTLTYTGSSLHGLSLSSSTGILSGSITSGIYTDPSFTVTDIVGDSCSY